MRARRAIRRAGVGLLGLLALLLSPAAPAGATMELIGHINGKPVILIWGNECSALDPPGDNVSRIAITYTGPPQPGVFGEVSLYAPFDSFDTDGATYLTVFASTPAPLPCPTCYALAAEFESTVDIGVPGEETPFSWIEYNADEGFCSGVAQHGSVNPWAPVPLLRGWGLALLAAILLATGVLYARRRGLPEGRSPGSPS